MTNPTIEQISNEEFDKAIDTYIDWASRWDGALPADVFFDVWANLQREKRTVQLNARLVDGRLELLTPQKSLIRTENNHIYLEDGRELVIQLET